MLSGTHSYGLMCSFEADVTVLPYNVITLFVTEQISCILRCTTLSHKENVQSFIHMYVNWWNYQNHSIQC